MTDEKPEPTSEKPEPTEATTPATEPEPTEPGSFVKVTFSPSGSVQIEWSPAIGPVQMLGAAEYIRWQSTMMLTQEYAARVARNVEIARVMMPPGAGMGRPDH